MAYLSTDYREIDLYLCVRIHADDKIKVDVFMLRLDAT